jgi:hypothetical protein
MITWIRNWFERVQGQSLLAYLSNGAFTVSKDQDKKLALLKLKVGISKKRIWGIIPVFSVTPAESISFSDLIRNCFSAARDKTAEYLKQIPQNVFGGMEKEIQTTAQKKSQQFGAWAEGEVYPRIQKFDSGHLKPIIKSDRNKYRQSFLEEVAKQSSETFKRIAKKRLADLVMKVRQETAPLVSTARSEQTLALPTGTRFSLQREKMTLFVIEQPPQTRTVRVMDADGEKGQLLQLSFPHVVFFVTLRGRKSDRMYVFFRKEPLRSTKDKLLCAGLPNIYKDFHVCFSPSAAKETLAEMAEESIGNFWGGRFVRTHDPGNLTKQIDIEKWADETKKASSFGQSYTWRSSDLTVDQMIQKVIADFNLDPEEAEKPKNGKQVMTAIESAVDNLATTVANEMKEACFNLVPNWTQDESLLTALVIEWKAVTNELSSTLKTRLMADAAQALSEKELQAICSNAIQKALHTMDTDLNNVVAAAHTALATQIERTDDTAALKKSVTIRRPRIPTLWLPKTAFSFARR